MNPWKLQLKMSANTFAPHNTGDRSVCQYTDSVSGSLSRLSEKYSQLLTAVAVHSGQTGDGSSTSFSGKNRQRADVFVEFSAEEFTGDWLTLYTGWVLHHVLHVYLAQHTIYISK